VRQPDSPNPEKRIRRINNAEMDDIFFIAIIFTLSC